MFIILIIPSRRSMSFFSKPIINSINVRLPNNPMKMEEVIKEISERKLIHKRLVDHHRLYDCSPKGNFCENIFVKIFNEDLGFGQLVNNTLFDWVPESHKVGADFTVPSIEFQRVSGKTGQINKIGRLKMASDIREDHRIIYSSHRLTKHPDFKSIIEFLKTSHYDVTFLLSPNKKYDKYFWIVLKNIDFSDELWEWKETYNKKDIHTGWSGQSESQGIISATITKSMSAQLWIKMKLSSNRIIHIEEICY